MMPLRMLGALMFVFLHKHVVSDANTRCSTEVNPLTLDPPKVIGEYGDSFLVNCTSSDDYHEGMYWTVGSTKSDMEDEKNYIQWPVLLSDWNVMAECRINSVDSFECSKNLEIIIYKRPDGVSVSAKNHGLMVEGTEYLLDCDIINVAPVQYLTVMWYREREMLYKQTFNGTDVNPVNVSSTLRLLPDRDYNGSVFRCEAELQLGATVPMVNRTSSAPYTAVLSYKPEIQTGEGHYAGLEHEFRLDMVSCRVDGNPPPTVQWFHRGKPVSGSEPLTRSQSGKYTAVAENILGSSNTSVDITVEYGPSFTCQELYQIQEDGELQTLCEPRGIPEPDTTWFKYGKRIESPNSWTRDDSGNYTLQSMNKHGTATHLLYIDVFYKPEIQTGEGHYAGLEHEFCLDMVSCRVDGNPSPTVQWFHRGKPVSGSEPLTRSQSGKYTAVAENILGSSNTSVDITVEYAPELKTITDDAFVQVGNGVTLSCDAEGSPLPVFTWTCDGMDILKNTKYLNLTQVITNAIYSCTATNYLGSVIKQIRVHAIKTNRAASPAAMTNFEPSVQRGCPLVLRPSGAVVRFGDPASLNCSSSTTEDLGMSWDAASTDTGYTITPAVTGMIRKVGEVTLEPKCFVILRDNQCFEIPSIILYKTPVSVPGSTLDPNLMVERTEYLLKCDIIDVADVHNLKMKWYQDNETFQTQTYNDTGANPVNVSSTLSVKGERDYNGSLFRCEAEMQLGPKGPELILTPTSPHIAVVLYKPDIQTGEGHYAGLEHEFCLDLVSCRVDGNPSPTVQWFHRGKPVSGSEPLTRSQSGKYTAVAENILGSSNTSVDITVEYAPELKTITDDAFVQVGNGVTLSCDAEGSPLPVFTWTCDGMDILKNTKYLNLTQVITNAIYSCTATNYLGSVIKQIRVHAIKTNRAASPAAMTNFEPSVQRDKPEIQTGEGHYAGLEHEFRLDMVSCRVDGNPPPTVQWFHRGKPVSGSEPLTRSQSGKYTAVAENILGSSNTSVDITVEYGPSFTCQELYQIQEDGEFQTLCEPRGIPEPDTTWFKYGKRIESPNSWTRDDSGNYTLQSMNKHGTATHLLYIDVFYGPVFKMRNYTLDVTSGENVAFNCSAEGNPPPVINWEYTPAVNVLETTGGRQKNISITGATSTNAGVYICVAKNIVGSEVRSVSLMMTGKTSAVPTAVIWASPIFLVTIIIILIILILILIILIFIIFPYKRWKKHRQYNFVPDNVDESSGRSISMTAKPDGWGYD